MTYMRCFERGRPAGTATDETRAGAAPVGAPVIHLPDQLRPEPAPPPPRHGSRRSGKMKGRHFGPRPVADPLSANRMADRAAHGIGRCCGLKWHEPPIGFAKVPDALRMATNCFG